ncbi:MAG: protein kinase [Polyangiaceae bacterium]
MAAAPPPRPSRAARANPGPATGQGPRVAAGSAATAQASGEKAQTFFLGRYRVVEEIGVGGMASVHLGRMDGPGGFQKWVAIKRIHPNLVEDDQFVDMFLDEARIAAGINHANVAQVFDLGKDDGTYWIAMEYLHGEPLRELMRRCEERNQRISPDIAARVCADAAEGLHAAHELRGKNGQLLGLVHRDVTPHNLFITYEGYTKVVDFGIAKVADRLSETRAGTLKGKLAYMSPEQVRGQDDVDRTTDVFALGVVLWELTTGHRLFRMDTDLDTLEKVQACVVPPPSTLVPGYPIELESVVMKALAKKKPERFQTAREFSRALNMYLQRRGMLIGPEEVSAFVRELFVDRIRQREAHLAWAADVTSTINLDQLNAMKAARAAGSPANPVTVDDISLKSLPENSGPAIPPSGDLGRPSVPGAMNMAMRPNAGPMMPSANGAANGAPNRAPPAARPTVPSSPNARNAGAAVTSLVDDDEDIPTTVATRDQVKDLAAFMPNTSQPGQRAPANAGPMGAQQQQHGSVRATSLGLGGPPPQPGNYGAPPGPPNPGQSQLMAMNHPLGGTMAMAPIQGPAPNPASPMAHGQPFQPGFGGASQTNPGGLPTFGPPPSFGANPNANNNAKTMAVPPGSPGFYPPQQQGAGGQALPTFGPPPTMNAPAPQQQNQQQGQAQKPPPHGSGVPSGLRPSQIETALSLPRPVAPPTTNWNGPASVGRADRTSTVVLIAVAVLTAICVVALTTLVYLKYFKNPAPAGAIDRALVIDSRAT